MHATLHHRYLITVTSQDDEEEEEEEKVDIVAPDTVDESKHQFGNPDREPTDAEYDQIALVSTIMEEHSPAAQSFLVAVGCCAAKGQGPHGF